MKVNGPKNINMLLHLLIWFDTCHGQRWYTKRKKKRTATWLKLTNPTWGFPFASCGFQSTKTDSQKILAKACPTNWLLLPALAMNPYRILIHQRLTPNTQPRLTWDMLIPASFNNTALFKEDEEGHLRHISPLMLWSLLKFLRLIGIVSQLW